MGSLRLPRFLSTPSASREFRLTPQGGVHILLFIVSSLLPLSPPSSAPLLSLVTPAPPTTTPPTPFSPPSLSDLATLFTLQLVEYSTSGLLDESGDKVRPRIRWGVFDLGLGFVV